MHYAGLSRGLRRGPVEEISLSRFGAGYSVSIVSDMPPKFEGREVAARARSRIGEDNYRVLTNNCEHFCEWCLRGQPRSYQIDASLALPSRALHMGRRLIAELLSLAGQRVLRSPTLAPGPKGQPVEPWRSKGRAPLGGSLVARSKLVQDLGCLDEVASLEAFGEAVEDRVEKFERFVSLGSISPESGEADASTQL